MIPIVCISILTVLCLFFVWASYNAIGDEEYDRVVRNLRRKGHFKAANQIKKWARQRYSKGRFIKEGM